MLLASRVCHVGGEGRSSDQQSGCKCRVRVALEALPGAKSEVDLLSCVFVSIQVLRNARILNNGWARLHAGKKRQALVRLVETSWIRDKDECIYMNPILAFNLRVNEGATVEIKPAFLKQNLPPIAHRVTIARVRSPDSNGHAEYGPALREFFATPRVLRKSDIIAIPIKIDKMLQSIEQESDDEFDEEDLAAFSDILTPRLASEDPDSDPREPEEDSEDPDLWDALQEPVRILADRDFDLSGAPSLVPKKVVFFQVTELAGADQDSDEGFTEEGMLVDGVGGETMLAQAGAVNTRVPDRDLVLQFYTSGEKLLSKTMGERKESMQNTPLEVQRELEGLEQAEQQGGAFRKKRASVDPSFEELLQVLKVGANPQVLHSLKRFSVLLYGGKGTGKRHKVNVAAKKLGFHVFEASLTPLRGLPEERAAKRLKSIMQEGAQLSPCIIHLRHLHALAPLANGSEKPTDPEQVVQILKTFSQLNVIVIGSTQSIDDVPAVLRGCFTHEVAIPAPDKEARLAILEYLTSNRVKLASDVSLDSLATRTAGRTAVELRALFANAACLLLKKRQEMQKSKGYSSNQSQQILEDAWSSIVSQPQQNQQQQQENEPLVLTQEIIDCALEGLPSAASMAIGAPKIPQVYWKDVGGLGHAKEEILDMVQLPLQHPELFASGVRQRSGILLYGPPGTGKTLLAKAVATECNLNFISVKGPELLDMYIGESERKVRQVFETARSAKPCVLFFDELDSLAPQRGRGADSGGVMDRVVSQLLTEIDGMQGNADVFVIGATNRPDLLDQSLLRPGRFDRLIYLGICRDRDAQLKIVKALTRKYVHDKDVDLDEVLSKCPFNFTGADFYALCSGAMAHALQRRVREIQDYIRAQNDPTLTARKYLAELAEDELQVTVKMCDYLESLRNTVPSVSEDEIRHYEALREKFSSSSSSSSNASEPTSSEPLHSDNVTPSASKKAAQYREDEMNGIVADNLKRCPYCQTPFLKEGGCDDITCPVCQAEYKWSDN